MQRVSRLRGAAVLFLLLILMVGSAATVSLALAEVLFVVAAVFIVAIVVSSIVGPRLGEKRK